MNINTVSQVTQRTVEIGRLEGPGFLAQQLCELSKFLRRAERQFPHLVLRTVSPTMLEK